MPEEHLDTVYLNKRLDRMKAGDLQAQNELISKAQHRLEKLAGKMLQSFPQVRRWEAADDVLQNALLRLLRSLEQVRPANTREFFALAATHIRRELIDLARHYQGACGLGANLQSGIFHPGSNDSAAAFEPQESSLNADELDRWVAFHQTVEKLPVEEREVFGLAYYHGWSQTRIAELFQKDERSIRRYWKSACEMVRERVNRSVD